MIYIFLLNLYYNYIFNNAMNNDENVFEISFQLNNSNGQILNIHYMLTYNLTEGTFYQSINLNIIIMQSSEHISTVHTNTYTHTYRNKIKLYKFLIAVLYNFIIYFDCMYND